MKGGETAKESEEWKANLEKRRMKMEKQITKMNQNHPMIRMWKVKSDIISKYGHEFLSLYGYLALHSDLKRGDDALFQKAVRLHTETAD